MFREYEPESLIMQQLTLKPMLFSTHQLIGDFMKMSIKREQIEDIVNHHHMDQLRAFVLGRKVEEIPKEWFEYPRDWWHAFKQRFFPKWLLKRYPIEMKKKVVKLEVFHLCPHVNIPWKGDRSDPHVTFLLSPSLWPMPNSEFTTNSEDENDE